MCSLYTIQIGLYSYSVAFYTTRCYGGAPSVRMQLYHFTERRVLRNEVNKAQYRCQQPRDENPGLAPRNEDSRLRARNRNSRTCGPKVRNRHNKKDGKMEVYPENSFGINAPFQMVESPCD